jgi:hypothetical protein
MFKKLKIWVICVLIATFTATGLVFATEGERSISAFFRNIRIFVDGAEHVFRDSSGNNVEPFIHDGTIYIPLHETFADLFDRTATWDDDNSIFYIGRDGQNQPDNWLDRVQYNRFARGGSDTYNFWKIDGRITDFLGNEYTNGMLFHIPSSQGTHGGVRGITDDPDGATMRINYPLNGNYKCLLGTIVLPHSTSITGFGVHNNLNNNNPLPEVRFYADDRLIHTIDAISVSMPLKLDLDITGVNNLMIKFIGGLYTVAFTDLALFR